MSKFGNMSGKPNAAGVVRSHGQWHVLKDIIWPGSLGPGCPVETADSPVGRVRKELTPVKELPSARKCNPQVRACADSRR